MSEALNIPSNAAVIKSTDIYELFHSRRSDKLIAVVVRGLSNRALREKIVAKGNFFDVILDWDADPFWGY